MAFQFQAVGAVGPGLERTYSIGLDDIGFAIGLYFLPGAVLAIPGLRFGAWFGEGRLVAVSLGLMAVGAAVMAMAGGWNMFIGGQVLAGVGGVTLNMVMSKMIADWFAKREIATAMSIFVNSWPVGIGLSLVFMPPMFGTLGVAAGFWVISVASLVFAILVGLMYRAPATSGAIAVGPRLTNAERIASLASGAVWGLFNAGLAIVFGFGTSLLVDAGQDMDAAARATSLVLWVTAVLSPLGGIIADRVRSPRLFIAVGLAAMAVLIPIVPVSSGHWTVFAAIGVCTGSIAGAIMALPALALRAEVRAVGMGLFFTVYYVSFVTAPAIGGALAEASGSLSVAFMLGGAFEVAALLALFIYARAIRNAELLRSASD